jgi:hypothetical protein
MSSLGIFTPKRTVRRDGDCEHADGADLQFISERGSRADVAGRDTGDLAYDIS